MTGKIFNFLCSCTLKSLQKGRKKTKKTSVVICFVLVFLAVTDSTMANFVIHGNDQFTVNSSYSYGRLHDTSQVFIGSGGQAGNLLSYDHSTANISGGLVNWLHSYDHSTVNMSNGQVNKLRFYNYSSADISGGNLKSLIAYHRSSVDISGGDLESLNAYRRSSVAISGGNLKSLTAHTRSFVDISGGKLESLNAHRRSSVDISGGKLESLTAHTRSSVDISGGTLSWLVARQHSSVTFHGSDFAIDGIPVDFGKITSLLGGSYTRESFRTLTGTLENGDIIDNHFRIGNKAEIILAFAAPVPEPASAFLVIAGMVLFRLRNRKQ